MNLPNNSTNQNEKKTVHHLLYRCRFLYKSTRHPETFTLQEAIDWGMEYNRTLQSASMEYQKAHKEKWKTISIGFPQINANLQYQNNLEQPVSLIPAQFLEAMKENLPKSSLARNKQLLEWWS